jgi:hypothetical protein
MPEQSANPRDLSIYLLGAFLGFCAGALQVKIGDLLFTALVVLASTMLLGVLRPKQAWRWSLLVGIGVPIVTLLAYLFLTEKPYRAQIYESALAFLPGIAGAYSGAVAHRGWNELFGKGGSST